MTADDSGAAQLEERKTGDLGIGKLASDWELAMELEVGGVICGLRKRPPQGGVAELVDGRSLRKIEFVRWGLHQEYGSTFGSDFRLTE